MSEFLSLVQDFKKHVVAENGLKRTAQKAPQPQASPPSTPKPAPKAPTIKESPPKKVEDTKVALTPFRNEVPSETATMLEAIRKNCPSIAVSDETPDFEESLAPVNFLYSTAEEKSFIEKVAKALEQRSIPVVISEAPIEKARLTICSKSATEFKGAIILEEISLYNQDAELKRTLWETLKTHLGLHN